MNVELLFQFSRKKFTFLLLLSRFCQRFSVFQLYVCLYVCLSKNPSKLLSLFWPNVALICQRVNNGYCFQLWQILKDWREGILLSFVQIQKDVFQLFFSFVKFKYLLYSVWKPQGRCIAKFCSLFLSPHLLERAPRRGATRSGAPI